MLRTVMPLRSASCSMVSELSGAWSPGPCWSTTRSFFGAIRAQATGTLRRMTALIVIVLVLLVGVAVVLMYNRLVRLRNRTENSWSQVDVQLQRRHDLI